MRTLAPGDEPRILELVRTSLGEGNVPRTAAYWRWKHEESPFGRSYVILAETGTTLVGLRAFMRWRWRSGMGVAPAVRAVDTATHPAHRGKGVFTRLTVDLREQLRNTDTSFIFNTPNHRSRPGYLKMGWVPVGRPTLWVRPARPLRGLNSLLRRAPVEPEADPPSISAASAEEVLDAPTVGVLARATIPNENPRLHTELSMDYVRWRYVRVPGVSYQAVLAGDDEDGAMAILRTRRRGAVRELRVVEMLVGPTPEARHHARKLLRWIPTLADVDFVIAMPGAGGLERLDLLAAGYLPIPRSGPLLTTYPFSRSEQGPDPRHLSHWALSIGDLELF